MWHSCRETHLGLSHYPEDSWPLCNFSFVQLAANCHSSWWHLMLFKKNNNVEKLNISLKKKKEKNCVSISQELQASHTQELCTCLFLLENIQTVRRMSPFQNEFFKMKRLLDKCRIFLSLWSPPWSLSEFLQWISFVILFYSKGLWCT